MATTATDMDTLKQALYESFNAAIRLANNCRTDAFEGVKGVAQARSAAAQTAQAIIALEQGKPPAVRK
jgi:hypothetical protein